MDALTAIARTVLYEGYILWPYRRSATKNQQRWTFGGVYPPAFAASSGGADRCHVGTECLLETHGNIGLTVNVRFLHVVRRQAMRVVDDRLVPVDRLHVGEADWLTWDEAVERDVHLQVPANGESTAERSIAIDAGSTTEEIRDGAGRLAGALHRSWASIAGHLQVKVTPLDARGETGGVRRLQVRLSNVASDSARMRDRESAIRHTMVSAHVVLQCDEGGSFVSSLEPPDALAAEVARCRNEGLWPVLVGARGARDTILASPIILYDYPRVAAESPGDMFDGGEIDQLLVLNVLALTDDEQREMRATDPRAREILERCTSLSDEQRMLLHATVRSLPPDARADHLEARP